MSLKKRYLKSRPVCKCTFILPKDAAPDARQVSLVGDFNHWQTESTPMKRLKTGDFKLELALETGRTYQYRYLIDGELWENDWAADAYVPAPGLPAENSVVQL
ncbi:MAG: isoamylase early set domain-containing protein [Saccharospirillum sp.]